MWIVCFAIGGAHPTRPRPRRDALGPGAERADGAPRAPAAAVLQPEPPGDRELLGRRRGERVRGIARMRERGILRPVQAPPRRRRELHAAEVAVPGVRRPRRLVTMDA